MKDVHDYPYVLRLCMLYRVSRSRTQGHGFLIAYSCQLEVTIGLLLSKSWQRRKLLLFINEVTSPSLNRRFFGSSPPDVLSLASQVSCVPVHEP